MYRATYRCFVDGLQEKLYFEHLQTLLKKGREKVVTFSTTIGNYENLLTTYTSYPVACVFDHDLDETRFKNISLLCSKYEKSTQRLKKSERHRVFHAYSNICFDLWLVLHKEDFFKPANSTGAYASTVRKIYGLQEKDDIKQEKNIRKILSHITLIDVKKAIENAKKIRSRKLDSDKIAIDKTNYFYYENPDLSIDSFLEHIITEFEKH